MLADQHGPDSDSLARRRFRRARLVRGPADNVPSVILAPERLRQDRACARADVADFGDLLAPHQNARHERLG